MAAIYADASGRFSRSTRARARMAARVRCRDVRGSSSGRLRLDSRVAFTVVHTNDPSEADSRGRLRDFVGVRLGGLRRPVAPPLALPWRTAVSVTVFPLVPTRADAVVSRLCVRPPVIRTSRHPDPPSLSCRRFQRAPRVPRTRPAVSGSGVRYAVLERVDGDLDRCDTLGRARSTVDDVLAAPFLRVTTFLRRTARGALQGRRLPESDVVLILEVEIRHEAGLCVSIAATCFSKAASGVTDLNFSSPFTYTMASLKERRSGPT